VGDRGVAPCLVRHADERNPHNENRPRARRPPPLLIAVLAVCTSRMIPFRTAPANAPATSPSLSTFEPSCVPPSPVAPTRTCAVCGKPIRGRAEKRSCSGRCRLVACRQRRHAALLDKLAAAEEALAQVAEAVAALREIAAGGPHVTASLAVGGGR
jgi:predicted nucleic acid-binding Zn ribbon protein